MLTTLQHSQQKYHICTAVLATVSLKGEECEGCDTCWACCSIVTRWGVRVVTQVELAAVLLQHEECEGCDPSWACCSIITTWGVWGLWPKLSLLQYCYKMRSVRVVTQVELAAVLLQDEECEGCDPSWACCSIVTRWGVWGLWPKLSLLQYCYKMRSVRVVTHAELSTTCLV